MTQPEPRYPVGTPEYDAYVAELRTELDKFARGEDPYPYAPADRGPHREPNLTDVSAPEDPYDHDAWSAYLEATTPEPTREQRIATLIEFGNPYAEKRAKAVEGYRGAARDMWLNRQQFGWTNVHTTLMRSTMKTYAEMVRIYDRLARSWAVGQLLDSESDQMRQVH